jgi:transcription elongation factor Elf1
VSPRNEPYKVPRNTVRMYRRETRKMVNGPYYCPKCSKNKMQIMVDPKKKEVTAVCMECGVKQNLPFAPVFEPIDYYNKFVDQLKKQP